MTSGEVPSTGSSVEQFDGPRVVEADSTSDGGCSSVATPKPTLSEFQESLLAKEEEVRSKLAQLFNPEGLINSIEHLSEEEQADCLSFTNWVLNDLHRHISVLSTNVRAVHLTRRLTEDDDDDD